MKNVLYSFFPMKAVVVMLLFAGFSCVNKKNVIAVRDANGVVIMNYENVKDTIEFPLSNIIDDLTVVQLSGDSLSDYVTYISSISDNYVLGTRANSPLKLFDLKSGKLISTIGNIGNGPGEYINYEDIKIDEKRENIFIFPSRSTSINVYDFSGKWIKEIPLANKYSRTAKFSVDPDRDIITVYTKLFKIEDSKLIWQQDFEGNETASVIRPDLKNDGYIDEVSLFRNSNLPSYYVHRFDNVPDSLFNYDPKTNQLKAVFTMDLGILPLNPENKENVVMRIYNETGGYFFGTIGKLKEHPRIKNAFMTKVNDWIVVDKKDLTGGYAKFVDDFIGSDFDNISIMSDVRDGYLMINRQPDILIENLNKAKAEAEGKKLARIENVIKGINEEGNYVVVYGKFKK